MDRWVLLYSILPVEVIIFILGLLMPELVRKEIFFGVRIPEGFLEREDFRRIKGDYKRILTLTALPFFFLHTVILYLFPSEATASLGIVLYLVISYVNFYTTYKKVVRIKIAENWSSIKREVTIVDTSFRINRKKRLLVSPLWFLIPFCMAAFNFILPVILFDTLPDRLPIRSNMEGEITGWISKSYGSLMTFPIISLITLLIMFFVYKTIGWAKQLISTSSPEASKEKNRIYRYRWSCFVIFLSIMMMGLFTWVNLKMLMVIPFVTGYDLIVSLGFGPVIIAAAIIMSVWTGQGGSRVKLAEDSKPQDGVIDRNDDRYWKLGTFYYNPDDPAVWIEKRFGIGMTMNFARPSAYIFLAGVLGIMALIPLIIKLTQ